MGRRKSTSPADEARGALVLGLRAAAAAAAQDGRGHPPRVRCRRTSPSRSWSSPTASPGGARPPPLRTSSTPPGPPSSARGRGAPRAAARRRRPVRWRARGVPHGRAEGAVGVLCLAFPLQPPRRSSGTPRRRAAFPSSTRSPSRHGRTMARAIGSGPIGRPTARRKEPCSHPSRQGPPRACQPSAWMPRALVAQAVVSVVAEILADCFEGQAKVAAGTRAPPPREATGVLKVCRRPCRWRLGDQQASWSSVPAPPSR